MLNDSKLKPTQNKNDLSLWWKYTDELANMGGFSPTPEYYKIGYKTWIKFLITHPDDYKNYNFKFGENKTSVEIIKP